MNGDLKWAARNEEAAIERRLGKNRDALAIYDEVLKNEAKPPERREALCGKGDVLYEMGAADPQNYRRAIELYQQLADEPGRAGALAKPGGVQERESAGEAERQRGCPNDLLWTCSRKAPTPHGSTNFSGSTRPVSAPRICSRKRATGKRRWRFIGSSRRSAERAATKRRRA